jgi:hypothetical protein
VERRRGRGEGSMKRKEGRLRGQPDGAAARSFTLSFARWGRAGSRCTWRAGAAAHTAADGRLGYAPLRALVTCTPSHAQTQGSTTPAVSTAARTRSARRTHRGVFSGRASDARAPWPDACREYCDAASQCHTPSHPFSDACFWCSAAAPPHSRLLVAVTRRDLTSHFQL